MDSTLNDSSEVRTLIKPGNGSTAAPLVLQLSNSADAANSAFSFRVVGLALLQRLKIALPLGVILAAAACAGLWHFSEDQYKASSLMQIHNKPLWVAFERNDPSPHFAQTQVELLRNRVIIELALQANETLKERPEFQELEAGESDPVQWIQTRLKVGRIGQSELYEVSFTARDPETAQQVVAGIVSTYTEFHFGEEDRQQQRVLVLLKQEHDRLKEEIDRKRETLREMARKAGGNETDILNTQVVRTGQRIMSESQQLLANLQARVIEAQIEATMLEVKVNTLQEDEKGSVSVTSEDVAAALASDPNITRVRKALALKQADLRTIAPGSKPYRQTEEAIARLEEELEGLKEQVRPRLQADAVSQFHQRRGDAAAQAKSLLDEKNKLVAMLREEIDEKRKDQQTGGDKGLDLEFARDDLLQSEEVFKRVGDRITELTTEGTALRQVKVLQEAKVPLFPEGPTLLKKMIVVGAGCFAIPFALLIGWDLFYKRVFEREQIQREMNVKFVSEVASLPSRPVIPRLNSSRTYKQQALMFEESVNSLRTTLSVDKSLEDCRVFVVASAVSGEGKTNLSSQLAMSWSQAEPGKVIIVDADLRAPNIHELFEVQPKPGLAEVLRGECSLEDAVIMDWGDKLYILPAGDTQGQSPSQLFSSPRFREVVARLKSQYQKVVFDVPPVLCASETLLVAKQADGVLMCALRDYSRAGQVKQAYDRLAAAGVNVVGAVLNGTPVKQYASGYYGYGYGAS